MVDVVVTDNILMVLFSSYEFPINDFISLIMDKSVKRLCDRLQIQALGDRLDTILAFGGESNLSCLTPAKEIERYLSEPVVLAHVVHCLLPAVKRGA